MNLFTGRNLNNDECIFDVHSFARELDEDTLRTKVNGGCCDASAPPAPPAGNNTPKAPAITGTSQTKNPGTSPTTNTPNPSDPFNPGSGYTGGGYEPPPEVMSNPQAYGYWKALQALAEQQGDPDRYKDYNVDGTKFVSSTKTKNTYSSDDRLQRQIDSLTKKRADLNKNDSIYGAPTDSRRVTSPKGVRTDANPTNHTGIDIGAKIPGTKGDNIYSVENGKVIRNGLTDSGCSRLEISLPNGDTAVYIHGEFPDLKPGDYVGRGQVIGSMSDIGSKGQVHLHFEIRTNGVYTKYADQAPDPLDFIPKTYFIEGQ